MHARTFSSDALSRAPLHFLCVGSNTKGSSVLSWPVVFLPAPVCVFVGTHEHAPVHTNKKPEENYSTYECV